MNVGKRILTAIVLLVASGCSRQGSARPPHDPDPMLESLRLESLYMHTGVQLAADAPLARSVSLTLTGHASSELKGTLVLDPNACSLDAFGDPLGCTRIAVRGIEVEVRRMSVADPKQQMRRYYDVAGEGLSQELALVVQGTLEKGRLERCYLVMGSELVPLYIGDEG